MVRRVLLCLVLATSPLAMSPSAAQDLPIEVPARRIQFSTSLPDGATLDRIRILSLLELSPVRIGNTRLSQLSALAWDDDEEILYALSDKGGLFHLKPTFEGDALTGVTLVNVFTLTDVGGKRFRAWLTDAEGMDILKGRNGRKGDAELLISFEHTPRIFRYRPDGKALESLKLPPALADAEAYQTPNRMLEAVCADSTLGVLTTPEIPFEDDTPGTTRIFNLTGKSWRYPRDGDFKITAMECLDQERVLVLERVFSLFHNSSALRIVTLPSKPSTTPLTPTTFVTFDAAEGHQTDNFEGLTHYRQNRFLMVSDDNDLFAQRTLLMYFELLPE